MGTEIERKFLVNGDGWRAEASNQRRIRQAYFDTGGDVSVRVRILDEREAVLTIKGGGNAENRAEFEYSIPLADAEALIEIAPTAAIEKVRHCVDVDGLTFEIDEFEGRHSGLMIAEVELENEDQRAPHPGWLGKDVTGNRRYYNAVLARSEGVPGTAAPI